MPVLDDTHVCRVEFTPKAWRALEAITDREDQVQIVARCAELSKGPGGATPVKLLAHGYRFTEGEYRIVFQHFPGEWRVLIAVIRQRRTRPARGFRFWRKR